MATELETLVVAFEASTTKFQKSVDKLNRDFSRQMGATERRAKQAQTSINASLSKIGKTTGGIGKGAVGGAIAGILGKFSVDAIEKSVAALAEIGDVAQRIGVTTDRIQELRYAVEQTGGTAEGADTAIQKFATEWGKAGSGVRDAFKQAGVATTDAAGNVLSVGEAFEKYLDIIQRAGSAQTQLALSAAGFGKAGGKEMVLLAQGGATAFRAYAEEARKAGAVIGADIIEPTRELDDKITALKTSIANLGEQLLASIAGPALVSAMQEMLAFFKSTAYWASMLAAATTKNAQGIYDLRPLINSFKAGTTENIQKQIALGTLGGAPSAHRAAQDIPASMAGGAIAPKPIAGLAGGVTSGGAAKTESDYEREVKAIQEKIAALQDEAKTVGMTTAAAAAYTTQQELLRAAAADGTAATEAEKIAIAGYAANIGKATSELEKLKAHLDAVSEAQKAFASEMSGAMEGLIVDGKSLNEVFADILNNLARMLIQASIAGTGPLAGIMGLAAPATGGAGGIAGLLMAGLAGGGPVKAGGAYLVGEKGPELMVPKVAGTIIPNEKLRAVERGGRGMVISMPVSINAPGADPAQLMRVAAELSALRADVPRQVRAGIVSMQSRRMR